jgi:hypothetical protein
MGSVSAAMTTRGGTGLVCSDGQAIWRQPGAQRRYGACVTASSQPQLGLSGSPPNMVLTMGALLRPARR